MDTDSLRPADIGSIAAIALSVVGGLVALPALPAEVTIHWAADGSPNTGLPVLPGIFVIPAFAVLAFVSLRGGAFFHGRNAELRPTTGLAVVAGVAYLQVALITLNLGVAVSPVVAVAPAVAVIIVATYAERFGAAGGA
ncbi:DUF1648 domain-containing protein [Halobaculum lipolyticum]|uniref:DUF1648 domain-containing protein n=1 Tax=Halobaculum lipolyticum TaxID=3032001 RepID=A0ABD5WA58_9EURY|nr:DUF1648 domain-containing protein [Halobaculum sp. DT31]